MASLILLALGTFLAVSRCAVPAKKSVAGELAVPDHLRPIIGRACQDCHTDQTRWPWYSRVPLVSYLIERDVQKGKEHLNFSSWSAAARRPTRNQLQEVCDAVSDDVMPPRAYRWMHPESRLSPQDVDALCDWPSFTSRVSESRITAP